jgi:hypothetical protein
MGLVKITHKTYKTALMSVLDSAENEHLEVMVYFLKAKQGLPSENGRR